jgi:signal transduction histidine kinase
MLVPVIAAANRLGAAAQVRDNAGRVVRSSPRFSSPPPSGAFRAPVTANGRRVGSVVLRFGSRGLAHVLAQFNVARWRARIMGGLAGALLGLAAAVVLASRIIDPLDRLLRTARARAAGHPDARVGQVRGFRDMRQLAASFDRMSDVLQQQDQLRRNLVADLAHELRTPVAVMQAQAEAMLDGITTTSPTEIESLHEELLRLARMIDDLQQLSEAEAATMQLAVVPCDLADQAAVAAGSMDGTFDSANVVLELRLSNAPVRCDKMRTQDVIRNLLTNAVKYTPAGGTVVVETRRADRQAMLRVADTGIGIAPDDLPHVTERFYRGSRSHGIGGSGIGLAVVDELVRAQHGALHIVSEPGRGTEVTILLPGVGQADRPPAEMLAATRRSTPAQLADGRNAAWLIGE